MPTVGQPVPGYYYDAFTDTLRPITGGPGPKGDPGNANVTVSPNAPAVAGKAGDLWVQTTTTPWTAPASMPWGVVAYKNPGIGFVSLTTTPTEVWRLSNVPLKAGRLYTCTVTSRAINRSAAGNINIYTPSHVAIAGTSLWLDCIVWADANYITFHWSETFTVTADGNVTVIIQAHVMTSGTGVFYTESGSGIRIEDIGPNRGQQ